MVALKQCAKWHAIAIWISEEEKLKFEDERQMEQLAVEAERESQRLAHQAILRKYELHPELIPAPPKTTITPGCSKPVAQGTSMLAGFKG